MKNEHAIMKSLQGESKWHNCNDLVGVPKVYFYGEEAGANFMAMELLEDNVDQLFAQAGKRFSAMSVLLIID